MKKKHGAKNKNTYHDTAMTEADQKIDAIKRVLNKRADALRKYLCKAPKISISDRSFNEGKLHGYAQAIELLDESLESISIEL